MSADVRFSLVPYMVGVRLPKARPDQLYRDYPSPQDEERLRLRFLSENPRCALSQDPEVGASELRCPGCNARGTWEDERTEGVGLCDAPSDAIDSEPYTGRKKASEGVWRCRRGHETREPVRPRKEPRGGGGRVGKRPPAGRNTTEARLVALCDVGG